MASTYTGQAAGGLTIQRYNNFRGVDFTDDNVNESRSPDSLNMWKDYKSLGKRIETRPDLELQLTMSNTIFGLFFYTVNTTKHFIIHSGTGLYDYNTKTKEIKTLKEEGMNPSESSAFIYNNIFFIIDGINYLEYDGATLKDVVGTVPLTTIARKPSGGGTQYQDVNLISDYRKNGFWGDGESTEYHLDSPEIDATSVKVWIKDVLQETDTYEVDGTNGIVTFKTAPEKTIDDDNVVIQYRKEIPENINKLKKCRLTALFDNRVFFSGNQNYPNSIFWCGYNDPRYISDMNFALEGTDMAQVKTLVPGNNALWVFKESSQANTTVFYHTPLETYDNRLEDTVKTYPSVHSSISTGCEATGINFNDDIVFFSDRGMEGISGDITTEQVLGHRSTLVDRKLLNETNYKNMTLAEWEGYLLVIIDNKVYLADSNQKVNNNDHMEYEWFYWELNEKIKTASVDENILYLCSEDGKIYTLTNRNEDREVISYWTTKSDDCNYPHMLKTTNKKGFKSDVSGTDISIEVKTDNNNFEMLGTYKNTKGYIVAKIKKKKWNKLQLKFGSTKPFGIYGITLETYIGSYVKRS